MRTIGCFQLGKLVSAVSKKAVIPTRAIIARVIGAIVLRLVDAHRILVEVMTLKRVSFIAIINFDTHHGHFGRFRISIVSDEGDVKYLMEGQMRGGKTARTN
jgi:hypothetical protein